MTEATPLAGDGRENKEAHEGAASGGTSGIWKRGSDLPSSCACCVRGLFPGHIEPWEWKKDE